MKNLPLPVTVFYTSQTGWHWLKDANGDDLCCFYARGEAAKEVAELLNDIHAQYGDHK